MIRKPILIVLLFVLLIATACQTTQVKSTQGHIPLVSLVRVISTPEVYLHDEINTIGILKITSQGDYLFLSKGDAEHFIIPNSLSLDFSSKMFPKNNAINYHGTYVVIRGKIRLNKEGIGNASSGILYEITEIFSEEDWGKEDK